MVVNGKVGGGNAEARIGVGADWGICGEDAVGKAEVATRDE